MRLFALLCFAASLHAAVCQNSPQLFAHGHIDLGVRFDTRSQQLKQQFSKALEFWKHVLDLRWYPDNTANCAIDVTDIPQGFAKDDIAVVDLATGIVRFELDWHLSKHELFKVSVHEIGHLLGLEHNASTHSVMYFAGTDGPESLDSSDLYVLGLKHKMRSVLVR